MRKLMLAVLATLVVAVAGLAACGDDDDDDGAGTATTARTASAKPTRTGGDSVTPTNGDVKTPGTETPDESTPAPTGTGPVPTPAAEGTPATWIADPNLFFSSNYPGKSPTDSECAFSPVSFVVTCGLDKYAPDPPLAGQDVTCALLSIDDAAVAIRCSSQEPLETRYYDIQE